VKAGEFDLRVKADVAELEKLLAAAEV
jgi:hypothetical protein